MRTVLQVVLVALASLTTAYFIFAYPHMTLADIWDSRGSRDGGSIFFTLSTILFIVGLALRKALALLAQRIK